MTMTNGTPIVGAAKPTLTKDQQDCVDVLSDALENALAGRISSVAIVVCMDDGMAPAMAGSNAGALNLGCDEIKHRIRAAIFEDKNAAAKRSKIMRVRSG